MMRLYNLPRLTNDPWINLAMAVAVQAILDTRSPSWELSREARLWLGSRQGTEFLHLLDLDPEVLLEWLRRNEQSFIPP